MLVSRKCVYDVGARERERERKRETTGGGACDKEEKRVGRETMVRSSTSQYIVRCRLSVSRAGGYLLWFGVGSRWLFGKMRRISVRKP
jgi:hypothetical protein